MRYAPPVLALLALGCPQPGKRSEPAPLDCASGFIADGESYVPEACGAGTWGELVVDDSTVYVDLGAAEGGDGSDEAPLQSIQAALDLAGDRGGGLVAVAAGTYNETLVIGSDHGNVHLAGRCRDLVTLQARGGQSGTPAIDIDGRYGEVQVSGLEVADSNFIGVRASSGAVRLAELRILRSGYVGIAAMRGGVPSTILEVDGCELDANLGAGVYVYTSGAEVSLVDTVVRDTVPLVGEGGGYGIIVEEGGALSTSGCVLERNVVMGLRVRDHGTVVSLEDTVIRDTIPDEYGMEGLGIQVWEGAELTAVGCELTGNSEAAVIVSREGTEVTLVDTVIRNTAADGNGDYGYGIGVFEGARLTVQGCVLADNTQFGILAAYNAPELSVVDTIIRDTLPDWRGIYGYGINAFEGAQLSVEGSTLLRNTAVGFIVSEAGTDVTLLDSTIQDTWPDANGKTGYGLEVQQGATLWAERCELAGNSTAGLEIADSTTEVVLRDSIIRDTLPNAEWEEGQGIEIHSGAGLRVEGCDLVGNRYYGLGARGEGTEVAVLDTMVRGTLLGGRGDYGFGIQAASGAALSVQRSELVDNRSAGLIASDPSTRVTLLDTTIRGTRSNASDEAGYGIQVDGGAGLHAEGCVVTDNSLGGILGYGKGTMVSVEDSSISGTLAGSGTQGATALGLAVFDGASVAASDLVAHDNQGPGLYAWGEGPALTCTGCTLHANRFAGAVVFEDGALEIRSSTITDTQDRGDLGGGVGVFAHVDPEYDVASLVVADSTISGNPVAGVWIDGDGIYQLSGNTISDNYGVAHGSTTRCGDGVFARGCEPWDGATGLLLEGNTISGNAGAGLMLDGSSALLEGNTWFDNAPDLLVQGAACSEAQDDWSEAPSAELCPSWDRPTCELSFSLKLISSIIEARMPPPLAPEARPATAPSLSPRLVAAPGPPSSPRRGHSAGAGWHCQ